MRSKKILVVDDKPSNFEVIEAFLLPENYQLNYANSGKKALNRIERLQPDVILLDVMMPELDGIAVCKQIKSDPNFCHIPIVMVTALNSKQDLARCLQAGADDFIGKPVNKEELRARVRSMLRIKQQYDTLNSTLKLREEMSAMIVHDLRSPIMNILLLGDLLTRANIPEKHYKKIEQILISGERLQDLIDDILVISKLEQGFFQMNLNSVDLTVIIQSAIRAFEVIARQKNIEFKTEYPNVERYLLLDINLFQRVIDNLLSNAIKFSPQPSLIIITLDYPEDPSVQAIIQVKDQGWGVDEKLRESIFEKFEIGTEMSQIKQIGLGLAFCKMIVEAHQGKIFVEDNQPKGAIFTIEI
ncbi:his Kinase A domain protein [Lyngbya aestuarii BL J]|uniref:histidine kinase n=1 Tax=Lyngbya aestuarii BL J TaxID=1348334 RepID=U7QE09_9CYAN|nr:hybrid sensor histidine kinase/response regulator [Lyngbya aestuarii]ERT05432.1 his Kinase A domain protein [Lyngbya aestuarii BL J]